ncbi:MAG: hypothetical protein KGL39_26390 [Patescibacteria group bacterium]|nr:hypothetical protein [Patescibacteria group bacterium]
MSCAPSPDTATKKTPVSKCCSDDPIDQYLNNPVVSVPNTSGGQSDIPAGMQPWDYCGYGPSGGCGHPSNWRDFCGNLYDGTNADVAVPCGLGGGPSVVGRNVFTLNPDYKYSKHCKHPGWKGVLAKAIWPGLEGFLVSSSCCPLSNSGVNHYLQLNTDLSLTTNASTDLSQSDRNSHSSFAGSAQQIYSGRVDSYGNRSSNAYAQSSIKYDYVNRSQPGNTISGQNHTDYLDECGTEGYFNAQNGTLFSPDDQIAVMNPGEGGALLTSEFTISVGCGVISIQYKAGTTWTTLFTGTINELNAKQYLAGTPVNNTDTGIPGQTTVTTLVRTTIPLLVVSLTDTDISIQASGTLVGRILTTSNYDGSVLKEINSTISWSISYTKSLSSEYNWNAVLGDCKALLNSWNLGDDEQYPWRQDGEVWLLPMVTRDAVANSPDGAIPPCTTDWSPTIEPDGTYYGRRGPSVRKFSESIHTGAIIGAPQPVGYARYFNFYQKVVCANANYPGFVVRDNNWFCITGWGQLSYDPLPKTATQWTDAELGSLLTEGAYVLQYGSDAAIMCKYAETLMDWPSANLARPFGRDRFLIDFKSTTLTDDPACSGTTGIALATYTSDIETDPSSFLYAHRKFPSCLPIGSTIGIETAVDNGDGTVTLTTKETHWLCGDADGHGYTDTVDFYGVPGLDATVTVKTATPGTTTFIVSGSLTSAYAGAGYIASAGVTAETAKWDWTCSRHNFVVQSWNVNLRYYTSPDYLYSENQGTLVPQSGLSVLICSPNSDTFAAGQSVYRAPWVDISPETCTDYWSSYAIGNKWISKFIQATSDPFYIEPVKCLGDSTLGNFCSSAFGSADSCGHFAFIEPLINLPPGAPVQQVSFPPTTYDAGVPSKVAHTFNFPYSRTATLAPFNATYLASTGWQEATHQSCPPSTYALANAAGYTIPIGGGIPPESQESQGGAGDLYPGAGSTSSGSGDSGGGL